MDYMCIHEQHHRPHPVAAQSLTLANNTREPTYKIHFDRVEPTFQIYTQNTLWKKCLHIHTQYGCMCQKVSIIFGDQRELTYTVGQRGR